MDKPYAITIRNSESLVTSRDETRAGFIKFALEKNKRSTPYIADAKVFKHEAQKASTPKELLNMPKIRSFMLTAAGLSDKALVYFREEDKDRAIKELIENFLEPEGPNFVDEVVYRFLLIKGDSLGGSMRNIVGAMAQQKFIQTLLSVMNSRGLQYQLFDTKYGFLNFEQGSVIESVKSIKWMSHGRYRTLQFNVTIPIVGKNIDICLFDSDNKMPFDWPFAKHPENAILMGELKGGIDPAGADEHWKTGNTALTRIRTAFKKEGMDIKTVFIAAAIESSMAGEIWNQLESGVLTNAANLTKDDQLIELCSWLLEL